jgi:hypothetical protein
LDPEECQLLSVFLYHLQSALAVATLLPAADFLQETTLQCCHIQRPQPNYAIIALVQQKYQTLHQVLG